MIEGTTKQKVKSPPNCCGKGGNRVGPWPQKMGLINLLHFSEVSAEWLVMALGAVSRIIKIVSRS